MRSELVFAGPQMLNSSPIGALEKLEFTRRHILAVGSILAGATLSACKPHVVENDKLKNAADSKRPNRTADFHRPNCFLRGTRVRTPQCEKRIEDLKIGDFISTVDGSTQSIRWIGRRLYSRARDKAWNDQIMPVRIARNALARDVPKVDLFVSQDHRLYLGGVLIRAASLVNGTSIIVDKYNDHTELEYLHVMVDKHALILSESATSETLLLDSRSVESFDNFAEYQSLYGKTIVVNEQPCAPVYADSGSRDRLTSHLRSALSPWIDRRNQLDKVRDRLMMGSLIPLCPIESGEPASSLTESESRILRDWNRG